MEVVFDLGMRLEKLNRIVAVRTIQMNKKMKPSVILLRKRGFGDGRIARCELQRQKKRAECDGENNAKLEGRQWRDIQHPI